jgi:hypothetical protein
VHAIGVHRPGDVRMVIYDEDGPRRTENAREPEGRFVDEPSGAVLVPVLEEPRPRLEGPCRREPRVDREQGIVKDDAEAPDVISAGYNTAP